MMTDKEYYERMVAGIKDKHEAAVAVRDRYKRELWRDMNAMREAIAAMPDCEAKDALITRWNTVSELLGETK